MHALKEKRSIPESYAQTILSAGLREGDEMVVEAFQTRRKSTKLTRVSYEFSLGESYELDTLSAHFTLPRFANQYGRYRMILVNAPVDDKFNSSARYLLESLEDVPFLLNGVLSYEAYIERGDSVDIGYNRLFFPRGDLEKRTERPLPKMAIMKSLIPICIEGETGTGKTSLAKEIHIESGRAGKFVHLNLSSFSKGLIESEIFGHIKGAFTGAINCKKGAIMEAHRGTLFLDEIDSLSLDLQTKLLIFLDNYKFRAVGSETSQKADIRLIIASGRDLNLLVNSGEMRKDFYFRLKAGVSIRLESLRENPSSISNFCHNYESENYVVIDDKLKEHLKTCPFPGNYRQLLSHLNKKKILAEGKKLTLDSSDLELLTIDYQDETVINSTRNFSTLEEVKIEYCYNVYLKLNKNFAKTAKVLDLSTNTLKAYVQKKSLANQDVV